MMAYTRVITRLYTVLVMNDGLEAVVTNCP